MQNLTFLVYCSITRRRAAWACCVIMSASSKMMSLYPLANSVRVSANCLICSRTTSIPRSSEALSFRNCQSRQSSTRRPAVAHLENLFAIVCPIDPSSYSENRRRLSGTRGAIEQKMWQPVFLDKFLDFGQGYQQHIKSTPAIDILVLVISLWETTSSNVTGRYFSTLCDVKEREKRQW